MLPWIERRLCFVAIVVPVRELDTKQKRGQLCHLFL